MSIEKVNITIIEHKELKKAVSARELYEFLEIQTAFTHWIERMIDYGFEENIDYIIYAKNDINSDNRRGRPSVDYLMTVEMAKEISMLQRSEKGKEARKYFIECERKLKEHQLAIPNFSSPYEAALAWAESYKREQLAIEERDIAIKTKSQINNKITATAMATASAAVRKVNKLENELGRGRDFKQAKAVGWEKNYFDVKMSGFWGIFGKFLTKFFEYNGYEYKKIDDPECRYRKLNIYSVEGLEKVKNYLDDLDEYYEYRFIEKYRIDRDNY